MFVDVLSVKHAKIGKRSIGNERQALPCAIIDNGQKPQPAPIGEPIREKVV